ncbi:MAG: hypothetical protein R3C55_15640 [Parvularculaceae bacterium]
MTLIVKTFAEDPSLVGRLGELEDDSFPAFLNEEPTWLSNQTEILTRFSDFHFFILDSDTGEAAAVNVNVPLCWDKMPSDLPTYNGLLERCLVESRAGKHPTALVGILGAVAPKYQGHGISNLLLTATSKILHEHAISSYLSPVRPSNKQLYPNFSFDEFLSWRTDDGDLVDPWLNHFIRIGAQRLGVAYDAITMTAPLTKWTEWTGMLFPVTGDYVIPGGHRLLRVDREKGVATYAEDHLWFDIPFSD